jgi:hypothetical protein
MKSVQSVDESSSTYQSSRPIWHWWKVMWKAFVTLFIIGGCGILFIWSVRVEAWFGSVSYSNAGLGIVLMIVNATLKGLGLWALWAFSTSVWTERQNLPLKGGLIVGMLFSAFRSVQSTEVTHYKGDPIAVAIRQNLPLPFWLLTFICTVWELRKQSDHETDSLTPHPKNSPKLVARIKPSLPSTPATHQTRR